MKEKRREKLYQVIADGPEQGQLKTLRDLVSEDGVTYLRFTDGTKCNIAFVGKLNDAKAYDAGMYVSEVYDTKNIWTFEQKTEGSDNRQLFSEDAGRWFTGADPYHKDNKTRTIIEATPPRRVISEDEIKSSKEKLRELGFDENTPGFEQSKGIIIEDQQQLGALHQSAGVHGVGYEGGVKGLRPIGIEEGTTINLDSDVVMPPTPKDMAKYQRANEIYIPEDLNESLESPISYEDANAQAQAVIEAATNPQPVPQQTINTAPVEQVPAKVVEETPLEDKLKKSPIWSIVSKCKKKECQAPLILNLSLPGKSIYNLIKEEYEDEALDDFFDIIISGISTEQIKESLKEALRASYERGKEKEAE